MRACRERDTVAWGVFVGEASWLPPLVTPASSTSSASSSGNALEAGVRPRAGEPGARGRRLSVREEEGGDHTTMSCFPTTAL